MRRFVTRVFLFPLALLFVLEAWLWDHLGPPVAWLVAQIPLARTKAWIARNIENLSPRAALLVFAVPLLLLFPLKLAGLLFLGRGHWFLATLTILFGKFLGMGVTAFLFGLTRDKLLTMPWFRGFYERVLWLRSRARALVEPMKRRILRKMRLFHPGRLARALELLRRIRRRAQNRSEV